MNPPPVGSVRRSANGLAFQVVANATDVATREPVVVYRDRQCHYFTRPLAEVLDGRFTRAEARQQ